MILVTGRTTPKEIRTFIRGGEAFTNSGRTFSGHPGASSRTGELPAEWAREYRRSEVTYTVYSYETPIAWFTPRGVVIPAVNYSPTTSQHQWVIRRAFTSGENYREALTS